METSDLIRRYAEGRYSPTTLASELIQFVHEGSVDSIMRAVPGEVAEALVELAANYRPGGMLEFGGAKVPDDKCIAALREWVGRRG